MNPTILQAITDLRDSVLAGATATPAQISIIAHAEGADLVDLFAAANRIRDRFRGGSLDLCSIINAKSGACSEDCRYCAQSSHYSTDAPVYPLIDVSRMAESAAHAKKYGAKRFCIVTSGRGIDSDEDLRNIAAGIARVRDLGMYPCATLGTLTRDQLARLRDAGLHRYHHNIETSREYFPSICTTHTFEDRLEVLNDARALGLSTCSGGIFGMGESLNDRISMAFSLREIGVDSIPINFLMPIMGTPLEGIAPLPPLDALRSIALFRFILPDREIRVCGGRGTLGSLHPLILTSGADGFMIGNYLTKTGLDPRDDLAMIGALGFPA